MQSLAKIKKGLPALPIKYLKKTAQKLLMPKRISNIQYALILNILIILCVIY